MATEDSVSENPSAMATATTTHETSSILDISDEKEFDDLLTSGVRFLVLFHTKWASPCRQLDQLFCALHMSSQKNVDQDHQHSIMFVRVDADIHNELSRRERVSRVPCTHAYGNGRLCRRILGADVREVSNMYKWFKDASDDNLLTNACEELTKLGDHGVTLICKSKCPFSRRAQEVLRKHGIAFELVEEEIGNNIIRERIKEIAVCESFPMLFSHGRFIGGLDVMEKLADERRLISELARKSKDEKESEIGADDDDDDDDNNEKNEKEEESLNSKLEKLTTQSRIMLFMKGSPDAPRCGFSRRIVETLNKEQVGNFGHFDILTDNDVRQGLKTYSKWPTFPQLYVDGKFVGGLDVINELAASGELKAELGI